MGIKNILFILFCLVFALFVVVYGLYCHLNPKEVSHYCIDKQCVSVVRQFAGRDAYLSVYKTKPFFRWQLFFGEYISFPAETEVLLSKNLENGKITVSCQSGYVRSRGNLNDTVNFKLLPYYSEGDEHNVSATALRYRILF